MFIRQMNNDRPQSSPLVDLKDPVQVHLLTETALSDSKGYEILSQEEVDDLKKQIQSLTMRVEQARGNLAIQSKYRDAAISMAKLYSPAKPEGSKRLSLRGNRVSDSVKEAEMERQTSERRCEELATELFNLEKRLIEPQRRLLQHTAGILQMTHRASAKKSGQPSTGPPMPNGIPGSPESLYTYTNPRNSIEASNAEADFGDRSLYLPLDRMEGQSGPPTRQRKNTIEIPMKSPIREQNTQLRGEMDRVKEDNAQLKTAGQRLNDEVQTLRAQIETLQTQNSALRAEKEAFEAQNDAFRTQNEALRAENESFESQSDAVQTQSAGQTRMISEIEAKLGALNGKLRDLIIDLGPARSIDFDQPERTTGSGASLMRQLQYLERGLDAAAEERESLTAGIVKESEMAAVAAAKSEVILVQTQGRIEGLVDQLQDTFESSVSLPPVPANGSLNDQLDYVEDAIRTIGDEMVRVADMAANSSSTRQGDDQVDAVLSGLWDIIQNGLAEAQQQKTTRRKARLEKGLEPDEEDLSDSEAVDPNEAYSLAAFSTKVQWLFAQATSLKEQKSILKRQIKQQRDLNSKSESEKDQVIRTKEEELNAKEDELDRLQELLDNTEREAVEKQEELAKALGDMERMQKSNAANDTRALQDQLKERAAALVALEISYEELESNYREVQEQLSEAEKAEAALKQELVDKEKAVADKEKEMRDKDEEIDRLNVMVIESKTEMAFAKAELDGAYGSRRERAAEVATLTQSKELEGLTTQVAQLKAELASTLRDFEDITRESIAAEREKIEIEAKLDDFMAAKESLEAEANTARRRLEAEVARLQDQLDGERLKVPPSPALGGPRAGATMLSEQFRATMKEERKKFQEELRVSFASWIALGMMNTKLTVTSQEEQAKRRKLEDEMRALRRGVGPGRSPLGPLSPR